MFQKYSEGDPNDIARIGMYCVQDSFSTLLLYQTLNIWFDLVEIANIAHIPASYVYVRGQGIRQIPEDSQILHADWTYYGESELYC